ncbi:NAD(P)-binding protein [Testicularia cyperi]|uniref:NAD(P)-binding protein n=1 Tax=Testicularia cyperi TaxID=1882483 RepID=A0A317XSA4_9BASI|nr:NAD(P)-binding protein [Testicularia cyperi]
MSLEAGAIFDLRGAVAVVTGGGTGLGLTAAIALASNGAKVYITGRRKQKLEEAVDTYSPGLSGSLVAIQGDVSSKEDLARVAAEVKAQDGKLHILVNNAGIEGPVTKFPDEQVSELTADEISRAHLANETFEAWDQLFRVNTASVFFSTMTFLPLLAEGNKAPLASQLQSNGGWTGGVINITSISGSVKLSQFHYAYNASKGAADRLTQMLAHELRFRSPNVGVRVNSLAPGLFASEMTAGKSEKGKTNPDDVKGHANPAGRVGTEQEFAGLILLLASNQFITGQVVAVDGGFLTAVASSR